MIWFDLVWLDLIQTDFIDQTTQEVKQWYKRFGGGGRGGRGGGAGQNNVQSFSMHTFDKVTNGHKVI